jgi:hypothetical protein
MAVTAHGIRWHLHLEGHHGSSGRCVLDGSDRPPGDRVDGTSSVAGEPRSPSFQDLN